MEHKCASLDRWHGGDQAFEALDCLVRLNAALGGADISEFPEQRRRLCFAVELAASQPVDSQVRGGFEEESAQVTHCAGLVETEQAHIGFLSDFPGVLLRAQPCEQEPNQRFVVLPEQLINELRTRALLRVRFFALLDPCIRFARWHFHNYALARPLDELEMQSDMEFLVNRKSVSLPRPSSLQHHEAVTAGRRNMGKRIMSAGFRLMNRNPASTVAACVALALGTLQPQIASADLTRTSEFNIAPQPLRDALLQYSRQSGVQVTSPDAIIQPKSSFGVSGELDARKALEILLKGTELSYEVIGANTVTIRSVPQRDRAFSTIATSTATTGSSIRLVQAEASELQSAKSRSADDGEQDASSVLTSVAIPEVLVEGSRSMNADIRRSEDDVQPYVVFDREQIERSGAANLDDFFRTRLPMNSQSGSNEMGNAVRGDSTWKSGKFNLRGLGANQTLILVDGRRLPSVSYGSSYGGPYQPDISGIPLSAIERIEVLPSTAGGIYGGSATGGVINIIRKRQYGSVEAQVSYENTFDSAADGVRFDLLGGFAFEGGKTQLSFTASHREADDLRKSERDFAARARARMLANNPAAVINGMTPVAGYTPNLCSADVTDVGGVARGFCSGTPLVLDDGTSLGDSIAHVPVGYAGAVADRGSAFLATAGDYNLNIPNDGQTIASSPKVDSFSANLRRTFGAHLEAFLDASSARSQSDAFWAETLAAVVDADAPTNPFQQDILVNVPLTNMPLPSYVRNDTLSFTGGLIARLPRNWTLQFEHSWARSRDEGALSTAQYGSYGGYDRTALLAAMRNGSVNALQDPNALPLELASYRLPVPTAFNGPFDTVLQSSTLRIAGLPFSLPAGPVAISALIERRKEEAGEGFQEYRDYKTGTSTYAFNPRRWQGVDSYYVEANAPLVSAAQSLPFVRSLDLQASVRRDEYDTVSTSNTFYVTSPEVPPDAVTYFTNRARSTDYTLGLRYTPVESLVLRASFGTGFLAPALGQVSPMEFVYNFGISSLPDPLRGGRFVGSEQAFTYIGGGNPDLAPEQSESWSAGLILTPERLPGLRMSVDYTRIRKTDEIANLHATYLLQTESDSRFPGRIVRGDKLEGDPAEWAGPVISIDQTSINLASTLVEVMDLQVDYEHETERFGVFRPYLIGTRALSFERQVLPTDPAFSAIAYSDEGSPLKWRGVLGLNWSYRSWTLDWSAQYYDDYKITYADPSSAVNNAYAVLNHGGDRIPSQMYHDLSIRYRPDFAPTFAAGLLEGLEVRLGVQNLFDKGPPIVANDPNLSGYSEYGDPRMGRYSLTVRKVFGAR